MTTVEVVALTFVAVWLGALTVLNLALVRQVALFAARLTLTGGEDRLGDEDGPRLGTLLSPDLPLSLEDDEPTLLLFFSASCVPCRQIVADLEFPLPMKSVALVTGSEKATSLVTERLESLGLDVVVDPQAKDVALALGLRSTPFALAIEEGRVVTKTYLRSIDDLLQFVGAHPIQSLADGE